jgi:hypothetical protein
MAAAKEKTIKSGALTAETAQTSASRIGAVWHYEPAEKILFASHPEPVFLATRQTIADYFEDGIRFWRRHCGGEKVFIVVNYENLTTNLDELEVYAAQVKRVIDECAITVVRYRGNLLQRMASRITAIKLHTPSNTYTSREEALSVVRGLRDGTISMPPVAPGR